jgi:hypothetical protein
MEYTECKDCKNMYKCEHTYIGGCSNGSPWGIKTIGTPEEFLEIMNKIKEEDSYDSFVNTFIKKENKDKDALIEEMLFDIGPTMTVNHNGEEKQVIFYPKESLAKVLIARGWVKL